MAVALRAARRAAGRAPITLSPRRPGGPGRDPRPDLRADSPVWTVLLGLASAQDGGQPDGVFGCPHGVRCLGARLGQGERGWSLLPGEVTPAAWEALRREWLLPRRKLVRELLETLPRDPPAATAGPDVPTVVRTVWPRARVLSAGEVADLDAMPVVAADAVPGQAPSAAPLTAPARRRRAGATHPGAGGGAGRRDGLRPPRGDRGDAAARRVSQVRGAGLAVHPERVPLLRAPLPDRRGQGAARAGRRLGAPGASPPRRVRYWTHISSHYRPGGR